jgi:hypothetical protein
MGTKILPLLIILGFYCSTVPMKALPKFASREGVKCASCHINPTGKGMRNAYGVTYGREALPIPAYKEETAIEDFSTNLTDNFSYGTDFRTLFFYDQKNTSSSFFQMQGDLYLNLRLNKKFLLYVDKGLYSGFEVFGFAKVLPLDGYIKVGKFVPAYGVKVDDHNSFIRGGQTPFDAGQFAGLLPGYPRGLVFGERGEDTGLELGFSPGMFFFNAGVFNGTPNPGISGTSGLKTKAVALRGEVFLPSDAFNLSLGASMYNRPSQGTSGSLMFFGGFGSLTFLKNITLTSEVDFINSSVSGSDVAGMIVFTEVNYMVTPGIDVKLGYEFYDPDTQKKNGSFTRITLGSEFFLMSGVELRPLYRFNVEQPTDLKNNEFQLMFHFYI